MEKTMYLSVECDVQEYYFFPAQQISKGVFIVLYVLATFSVINIKMEERFKMLDSEIDTSHLNTEEKNSITDIYKKFNEVFHLNENKLTVTNEIVQNISLKSGCQPCHRKPFRLPHTTKKELNNYVNEFLVNDIIEPNTSPWSSPLFLVPKKSINGEKR